MGYIRHHAMIVTGLAENMAAALVAASKIFPVELVTMPSQLNGYVSLFIPPDGSKEGWEASYEGDARRREFIEWLREQRYEDGSSPYAWAEVMYGDDEHRASIRQHGGLR